MGSISCSRSGITPGLFFLQKSGLPPEVGQFKEPMFILAPWHAYIVSNLLWCLCFGFGTIYLFNVVV